MEYLSDEEEIQEIQPGVLPEVRELMNSLINKVLRKKWNHRWSSKKRKKCNTFRDICRFLNLKKRAKFVFRLSQEK